MAGKAPSSHQGTLVGRASLLAAGTLLSRILGAVRDAVFAALFAVAATDAFFIAFTIPNALRVLLGEGAVSGAFVPVLTEVDEREGRDAGRRFFGKLFGAMVLVLLVVTALGIVFAPALVTLYAAGFRETPGRFELTVELTRVVFPYIFLMGIAALFTGALHARRSFVAPALAPIWLNIALIAAAFGLVPIVSSLGMEAIIALAIGALIGGALQGIAQMRALSREGLLVRPRLDLRDPHVRKAFLLLVPLLAGLGVYQLNVILARLLASYLPTGAVSYLYYSQRLVEIPQGMFAMAIASASLPTLSQLRARGETDELKRVFQGALRLSLLVAIPSSVAIAVLAKPLVTVLFGRGQFDTSQIEPTAAALQAMAAGIWAVASVRTIVPMFHAHNDTRTPVLGSLVNLLVFGAVSLLLMSSLEHVGLAIAISAAAVGQLIALLLLMRRRQGKIGLRSVLTSAARTLLASAAMGAGLYGVQMLGDWSAGGNAPRNIAVLLLAMLVGALLFGVAGRIVGVRELDELKETLLSKLRARRRA